MFWGLGFGLLSPIFPLYLGALGADPGAIGTVFGVGNVAGALLILPSGAIADRLDRRAVIVASCLVGTIGVASFVLLERWEWSIPGSILYWASVAALPVMSAHVAAIVPRAALGRAMGLLYGSFFGGLILASPLAGLLADRVGLRATIAAAAALFALSTISARLLSAGRVAAPAAGGRFPRAFWALLGLAPLAAFVEALPIPLLPVYVRQVVGAPLALVGAYVAAVSLGSAVLSAGAGRLADRFGVAVAVMANAVLLGVGCALAVLFASVGPLVAVGLLLVGANVASNPVLAALLERIIPPGRAAVGYSAFQLVYAVGFGIGGFVAGALYDEDARLPLVVTMAAALPIAAIVSLVASGVDDRAAAHAAMRP